jgi:hypothetical protein
VIGGEASGAGIAGNAMDGIDQGRRVKRKAKGVFTTSPAHHNDRCVLHESADARTMNKAFVVRG